MVSPGYISLGLAVIDAEISSIFCRIDEENATAGRASLKAQVNFAYPFSLFKLEVLTIDGDRFSL